MKEKEMIRKTYSNMEKQDFDYFKTLLAIEEHLTEEDVLEGISPEILDFDVAISGHAEGQRVKRNDKRDDGVQVRRTDVFNMVQEYGHRLYDIKNGDEFSVIDSNLGVGVVCVIHQKYPNTLVVVKTILNMKNLYVTRGTETLNMTDGNISKGFETRTN